MAKYYMANTVFQPYTYEQLYTTARDLTAAHNEQEAKLGALDSMAAGVEAYLDPSKHPEDQAMYDTLQNYRNGLNNVTYHLASRGLNGHVFNNVMSLAADYSGKVKPIEGAIENYKKAHDMRVALMTQNPDYIPRYSWDQVSVSENLNGASQRAVEGFKGTQYMNDITTTLQKLFNDFGLTKRNDIRIFGQQVYDYISNGMPVETALNWFADQTNLSPEDRAKMMLGISTINQRYGIDSLKDTNPAVLSELAGYQKQGVINAIGTHEMKTYENLWDKVAANVSQAKRIKALDDQGPLMQSPYPLNYTTFNPAKPTDAIKVREAEDNGRRFPTEYDATSKEKPSAYGSDFYRLMKAYLYRLSPRDKQGNVTKDYSKFADWSPEQISDVAWHERIRGLNSNSQQAYEKAYRMAMNAKSYVMHTDPVAVPIDDSKAIESFVVNNKANLRMIDGDGNNLGFISERNGYSDDIKFMNVSFVPSTYNRYTKLDGKDGIGKNDYVFIQLVYDKNEDGNADTDEVVDCVIHKDYVLGKVSPENFTTDPEKVIGLFNSFSPYTKNYDVFSLKNPEERSIELGLTTTYANCIVSQINEGRAESTRGIKENNKNSR